MKRTGKTFVVILVLSALAVVVCVVALICVGLFSYPAEFRHEQLDGEVRVNIRDGKAYVRWSEENGDDRYNVYTSKSLYGDYTLLTTASSPRCISRENVYGYYRITAVKGDREETLGEPVCAFGNTLIVYEDDDMDQVQARIAAEHALLETAMVIYADDTIGDNFWTWRDDHTYGVAWEDYTDEEGNTIYGNPALRGSAWRGRCILFALTVEHFEGYQTDWRGENGRTVM